MLCLLTSESKTKENKRKQKKKVLFMEDVKQPSEARMMCTIECNTFFIKNTWIRDLGASCHITNGNNGLYDVTDIDKLIQGSPSIMPVTKKGKL